MSPQKVEVYRQHLRRVSLQILSVSRVSSRLSALAETLLRGCAGTRSAGVGGRGGGGDLDRTLGRRWADLGRFLFILGIIFGSFWYSFAFFPHFFAFSSHYGILKRFFSNFHRFWDDVGRILRRFGEDFSRIFRIFLENAGFVKHSVLLW